MNAQLMESGKPAPSNILIDASEQASPQAFEPNSPTDLSSDMLITGMFFSI